MRVQRISLNALLCVGALFIGMLPAPVIADEARSLALVLDASGSMNAMLPDGTRRIDAAKAAIESLVGKLPADTRLALRVYGHQSTTQKKDCKDSALVVGFDSVATNKAAILEQTRGISARGYTPINYSLQRAAEDIGKEGAAERVVVLVSDGKETCEGDPCATARALADADAKLVVHAIGFGVDTVTRQQLQCIARVARGSYFDAGNANELAGVLTKAAGAKATQARETKQIVVAARKFGKLKMEVAGHFSHDVIDAAGKKIDELSSIKRVVELPPGIYGVKFGNGVWTGIEVKPGETTEIKPGFLEVEPLGSDLVYVLEPETGEVTEEIFFTKPRATLIPGRFDVRFGKVLWPGGVELESGKTTVLKPGVIEVESKLGIFEFVARDLKDQEVDRGSQPGKVRLALPPGKYVLEIDPQKWLKTISDDQRKVEVELGEGEEVKIRIE